MKYFKILAFALFLFQSCAKDPNQMLTHLNGYWEIEEVTLSDGTKKEYRFSNTIDYIEVSDNLTGFRKKLKPNLVGDFETSKDLEQLVVKIENDSLHVFYKTPYAEWKESIIDANENHLLIVNARKDVYLYKRYVPLDLDLEDQ